MMNVINSFDSLRNKTNLPWRLINERCKKINDINKEDHGKSVEFSIFAYPCLNLISMSTSNKIRLFFSKFKIR